MASFVTGTITAIEEHDDDIARLRVDIEDGEIPAVAFPKMVGPLAVGHRVVVNTTGIALGLGTGGTAFVLWDLDSDPDPDPGEGHIVKLRYTPWQTNVLAAEAPESPHHDLLADATSIEGVPVVACSLHSQMPAAAAGIKAVAPAARVGYLMTDGAALPLRWSRLAASARAAELIDVTATAGHAFGGDLEVVNVFSGLAALRHAAGAGAVVVAPGPGVVGTSTRLGHTALEQGQVLDAATGLGATAIACLRLSFADRRSDHRGISHHSLTALTIGTQARVTVVVPMLDEGADEIARQLESARLDARHVIVTRPGEPGVALMTSAGVRPESMGRSVEETPELFLAAAAAGALAGETLRNPL